MLDESCGGTENPAGYDSCTSGATNPCNSSAGYCASGCRAEHCTTDRSCITGAGNRGDSSSDYNYYGSSCSDHSSSPDDDWATHADYDEGGRPNGDAGHARCELRNDPGLSHHCSAARFATGSAECSRGTAVYRCARSIGCSECERGFDQHEFKFK